MAAGLVVAFAAACGGPTGPAWTYAPGSSSPSGEAPASVAPSEAPPPSAAASLAPVPVASPSAAASSAAQQFSGRMSHQLELDDGYLSMYMLLENTGLEPLTFLNTLYDDEPDQLYSPTVAFPWTSGDTALVTRAGRFFPSPAIVGPGQAGVYIMGGQEVNGQGELARPVANIKFCPTRGMDDVPAVPVAVDDVRFASTGGVTTVTGLLRETEGSSRPSLPVVGVAFFDAQNAFVGAVVANRVGDALGPGEIRPFEISGRGVAADRIDHAEAYAFIP
jgi:hypothetical protein